MPDICQSANYMCLITLNPLLSLDDYMFKVIHDEMVEAGFKLRKVTEKQTHQEEGHVDMESEIRVLLT